MTDEAVPMPAPAARAIDVVDVNPPWVLHFTEQLGLIQERWIDVQAKSSHCFDSRLLGLRLDVRAQRQRHWMVAADRPGAYLAYRSMARTDGLSLLWLAGALGANPPAALHGHYGTVSARLLRLARRLDRPLVASFYGFDATETAFTESRVWRRRYRRLFEDVSAVVVEGPAMGARVEALGCPQAKLRVVRLPADAHGLEHVERKEAETFTAVVAGWASEKKGFDTAVRAFAAALRGADARLLVLGGGPAVPALRRVAGEEGVADQVEWVGLLEFGEFMRRIGTASVALFPSRRAQNGDSEGGAPVTLIETQWLGVPVLVSDHDDLPFVAAPSGSVVLPATDVDAWADMLRELAHTRDSLPAMGAAAAAFVRREHGPAQNARAREAIYAEVSGAVTGLTNGTED